MRLRIEATKNHKKLTFPPASYLVLVVENFCHSLDLLLKSGLREVSDLLLGIGGAASTCWLTVHLVRRIHFVEFS